MDTIPTAEQMQQEIEREIALGRAVAKREDAVSTRAWAEDARWYAGRLREEAVKLRQECTQERGRLRLQVCKLKQIATNILYHPPWAAQTIQLGLDA